MLSVTTIGEKYYLVSFALIALDIVLAVYITNKSEPSSYKLAWLVIISIFPLLGGVTYVLIKIDRKSTRLNSSHRL